MPKRLLSHLRGNAIAYIALFAALGGTGYAAKKIGTKQLKVNAVTKPKIAANAVDGTKVQNASLSGADLGANSLGGAQVNEAGLAGVNATQLGGLPQSSFGSGVVMGKVDGLASTTNPQYAYPSGVGAPVPNVPGDRIMVTVPNQVLSDFVVFDEDLMAPPPAGDDLNVEVHWQGNIIASCSITSTQFPGCSSPTDGVIGDTGVNSLIIEVNAEDAAFYNAHDLVFAYRLTPAP